MEIRSMSL